MSDTRNVKMGVCKITYGGVDLGYTKGGVEVEVTTETHKLTVDQFGSTQINELIMGRNVKVKAPLAETTLTNLVAVMPGATLVSATGAKASGTITFAELPLAGDSITVNGVAFTFRASLTGGNEILLGIDAEETAANAAQVLSGSAEAPVAAANYAAAAGVLTVTYKVLGTAGNTFTLAASGTGISVSGATLAGGTVGDAARVEVQTGIGLSLLDRAKKLVLHPVMLPDEDQSEDFVIPRAGSTGGLQFAYKVDSERVFNVEFTGYPDPETKTLFVVGDTGALS
ncbi:MAG TPA: hypothetical protein VD978_12075 [Azospirillum sp.]|nr:hypothetical protein [Azospirillum sp.]